MSPVVHTVRFQLTVWYASMLSAILLLFGGFTYTAVRYQLLQHHDSDLEGAAEAVKKVLSEQEDCANLTVAQRARLDGIGHLILFHEIEGSGRVFYRSPDSSDLDVPDVPSSSPSIAGFQTVPSRKVGERGHGLIRRYSEPYRSRSGRQGLIHVAHDLGDVQEPLASLRLALLLMAPLAVVLSSAGGYWLAVRALAPVDEVTRTARQIDLGRLSERLPPPKARDEIGRLVDTFNQMIARLETSFEGMKRFTADASHELRGPLATMRGAIDVALARPRETSEYKDALASVGEDVDRLRSIVEDLLVLARADAGRLALEQAPVRLDVLTAEVAESLRLSASERGVDLDVATTSPVVVLGDERWLRQLVFNLLDNAVKFSARGREPLRVTTRVAIRDDWATLDVSDSGPGIPEDALGRVFERFYRADGARRYTDGYGLGLSIAKWIVEAQGGTVSAENQPTGGSLFRVTLPLAPTDRHLAV